MTLGEQIAAELRKRGQAGYFNYEQYRTLYGINSSDELRQFAQHNSLPVPDNFTDAGAFVDSLRAMDERPTTITGCVALAILDVFLMGIPSLIRLCSRSREGRGLHVWPVSRKEGTPHPRPRDFK
jgi:hypothetical protein